MRNFINIPALLLFVSFSCKGQDSVILIDSNVMINIMAVYNNPTYQALFAQQHCGLQPVPIGNGNYILNPASLRDPNYTLLWDSLNQTTSQQIITQHGFGKNISHQTSIIIINYFDSMNTIPVNSDTLFNNNPNSILPGQ